MSMANGTISPSTKEAVSNSSTVLSCEGWCTAGSTCVDTVCIMVPAENSNPSPVMSELDATSGAAPRVLTSTTTTIIITGAARQNAKRFLRTIVLGRPDPMRKLDSPNDAGAL
uniref:Uncharacterized protein n=1 Tax=Lotharella oceanica TaxID=641309 RepID=A0A7S2TLD0_9EUKA